MILQHENAKSYMTSPLLSAINENNFQSKEFLKSPYSHDLTPNRIHLSGY